MTSNYTTYNYSKVVLVSKQLFVCFIMIVLLLFSNTSREWLHQFSGHTDTIHKHDDGHGKGLSFDSKHHHCKFLEIPLPVYSNPLLFFHPIGSLAHNSSYKRESILFYHLDFEATVSVRGPPQRYYSPIII